MEQDGYLLLRLSCHYIFRALRACHCVEYFISCVCVCVCVSALVSVRACSITQLCLTLCDPMDCSPPVSSVHWIFQARTLEWVAISFSMGSSWPRDRTQVSCIAGRRFTLWATRKALYTLLSMVLFFKIRFIFYWRIVDLQFCVNYW